MQDTPTITIGQALTTYRRARDQQDRDLCIVLNITPAQFELLQAQPFPTPRRAELGELWIDPSEFHAAINVIAETAGIIGIYRDLFESMLLWYCYRQMDSYRAAIQYWFEKLENSYKPNTSFNNQMADIAIQIMREMRHQLL